MRYPINDPHHLKEGDGLGFGGVVLLSKLILLYSLHLFETGIELSAGNSSIRSIDILEETLQDDT